MPSRGQSVRNGSRPPPAKLNMDKARPNEGYQLADDRGGQRSGGSGRSDPRRQNTTGGRGDDARSRGPPRQVQRRRTSDDYADENEDDYPGELYDMYSSGRGSRSSRGTNQSKPRPQQRYTEEEESQYASDYDDGSFDENDFEMMAPISQSRPAPRSRAASSSRGTSRRPEIRKIRVKVHADDTRYIMIGPAIEFPDLVDRIRDKFGMRKRFKIKVRDDDGDAGDMITMADQDDLDMAIMSVKSGARKEKLDMGKMSVSFLIFLCRAPSAFDLVY